jgi:hypothetical protein
MVDVEVAGAGIWEAAEAGDAAAARALLTAVVTACAAVPAGGDATPHSPLATPLERALRHRRHGLTALHVAAQHGHLEVAFLCLRALFS